MPPASKISAVRRGLSGSTSFSTPMASAMPASPAATPLSARIAVAQAPSTLTVGACTGNRPSRTSASCGPGRRIPVAEPAAAVETRIGEDAEIRLAGEVLERAPGDLAERRRGRADDVEVACGQGGPRPCGRHAGRPIVWTGWPSVNPGRRGTLPETAQTAAAATPDLRTPAAGRYPGTRWRSSKEATDRSPPAVRGRPSGAASVSTTTAGPAARRGYLRPRGGGRGAFAPGRRRGWRAT